MCESSLGAEFEGDQEANCPLVERQTIYLPRKSLVGRLIPRTPKNISLIRDVFEPTSTSAHHRQSWTGLGAWDVEKLYPSYAAIRNSNDTKKVSRRLSLVFETTILPTMSRCDV